MYQSNDRRYASLRFLGFDCICGHKSNSVKLSATGKTAYGKPATNNKYIEEIIYFNSNR